MINWRKPIIDVAFRLDGYPTFKYLRFLKSVEFNSTEQLQQLQNEKLERLLLHAYENVSYYNRILPEAGVVKNGKAFLENFNKIPPLTKAIIRSEGENLYSTDRHKRGFYLNSTGGSTGEPTAFLHDKNYQAWSFAARFLFNQWMGKDIGEPELKLWGSERDTLYGAEKISTRLRRWGFNTLVLNSFLMTDEIMNEYIQQWNRFKPKLVVAYTGAIYQFSRYIKRCGAVLHGPAAIICAAETLHQEIRDAINEVFDCLVINQYGARETGAIACECQLTKGLHVFSLNHKLEILDDELQPCQPGQMGSVYITTLNNYSMPLIRYRIGDMAVAATNKRCPCSRAWPLVKHIIGRHVEVFKTRDGRIVLGEFFIHFVGVVYNKNYIKRFQVIQKDYDHIVIKIVVSDKEKFNEFKPGIVSSIKKVMGELCKVEFVYVTDIPPTKSGKYLYTISNISED